MIRDDEFYDAILRPIEEAMMACIWRITQNHEDAQDALQEALGTIWRKRSRIANHPKPEALVLRICRAKAIDGLRKSIRRTRRELPLAQLQEDGYEPVCPATAPDGEIDGKAVQAQVRSLITEMPPKQAQAVLMRLVENQEFSDIALALGCSAATVRSHIRRGRERLQKDLRRFLGGSVQ